MPRNRAISYEVEDGALVSFSKKKIFTNSIIEDLAARVMSVEKEKPELAQ